MSHTESSVARILVFESSVTESHHLVKHLRQLGDVQVESNVESALAALETHHFDMVVAPSDLLRVAGRSIVSSQLGTVSQMGTVLDAIGQGVCIVDQNGRMADNVSMEIVGPLSDILADASTLMEDYIGHDDLRHRLSSIIDNVAKIKKSVKQVRRPEDGILSARSRPPQPDPLLTGKSILAIDDEEIIRQTVRDVLTNGGCEVETAREGAEAMAMINRRDYDLVITDIHMPGHSGFEIFRAVKDRKADCPVIFMTGFGYEPTHSIIRAYPEGLSSVLYKPFKIDHLLSDVRSAIASAYSE